MVKVRSHNTGRTYKVRLIRIPYLEELPDRRTIHGTEDASTFDLVEASPSERRALKRAGFTFADAGSPAKAKNAATKPRRKVSGGG